MLRQPNLIPFECPAAQALERLGDWWCILILRDAFQGVRRFSEFRDSLGVATNILSSRLKHLTDGELLEQKQYSTHPPRFEYVLTEKGQDIYPVAVALYAWAQRHIPENELATWLGDRDTGRILEPIMVDASTGKEITFDNTILIPGKAAGERTFQRIERVKCLADDSLQNQESD